MASRASKNRHGVKKKRTLAGSMTVVAIVLVIVLGVVGGGAALLSSWFKDLPDYEGANAFNTSLPTYVYASDGETVLARFQLEYREPVEMDQINPYLPAALIATEDARFYEHGGIDLYGVMRALANNIVGGEIEGASTITQQFIRNTILADEMSDISIKRKAREAYLAMQMEKRYTKDEILLMYLNTINFGEGAYGAEAAAQRYFSKPATDLTLAEAALLAGIPQSPTYNDPLEYPEHALERRAKVLSRMLEENVIAKEEYDEAMATPLQLNPKDIQDDGIQAYPYFTSYVRWLLYNNYDLSEADILKGGLSVYTTLDIGRQQAAEEACAAKRDALSGDMEVAMAVVEPETGYIQALVGGRDYYESQVNLATGHGGGGRPCGSVFKMFTLAEAVKKGIDPKTTYVDCSSPATVDGYTLENYGNSSLGTRSIASAFAASSNTGFVRLISSVGVKDTAKMAYDLGVTTDLLEDEAGATLTLGVQNITPLELAGAAAAIANGGVHHDLCAITVIKDRDGKVLVDDSDPEPRAKRVLTPEQAYVIQEVMKGVVTSGTGTAAAMYNGQPVAGKTGTSEDYKDIAFVGYTPFLAAAIWVGDPMNVSAVPTGSCADVFRMFCTAVMENEGLAVQQFPEREYPKFKSYSDEKYHINSSGASYGDSSSSDSKSSEESEDSKKKSTNNESKKSQGNTTPTPTPTPAPAPAPEPAPTPTPTPEPAPTPTPTPEPAPTPTPGDGGGSDAGAGAGGS